jgi:photosystem II stability/assembly factor-like uncharacterized protein
VDSDLYDVHFPTPQVGYVVGANHLILRTADRGATWEVQGFRSTRRLWSVQALTETHAWAAGDEGEITFTMDGRNWEFAATDTAQHLYALSIVPEPSVPTAISTGLAVGERATGRMPSVSSGRSWRTPVSFPPTAELSQQPLYGASVRSGSVGIVVGDRSIYFRTTAGAWQPLARGEVLYGVYMVDDATGWAVGTGGTILKTTDAGASWTAQPAGTSATLYGVHFVDAQRGWVVGSGGTILATRDGGTTWQRQQAGTSADLRSVWFTSAEEGWIVGHGGVILRTTTGGEAAPPPGATGTPTATPPAATPTPSPTATPRPPGPSRLYLPAVFHNAAAR